MEFTRHTLRSGRTESQKSCRRLPELVPNGQPRGSPTVELGCGIGVDGRPRRIGRQRSRAETMTITSAGRWVVDRKASGEVSGRAERRQNGLGQGGPPGVGLADAAGQVRCWCAEK